MKNWIIQILIVAIAVLITAEILSGVHIDGIGAALILAILLSFLNTFLKPLLLVLSIPITILTLGLFLLFINAIIILSADALFDGFQVDGFGWAFLFGLILSIITSILEGLFGVRNQQNKEEE